MAQRNRLRVERNTPHRLCRWGIYELQVILFRRQIIVIHPIRFSVELLQRNYCSTPRHRLRNLPDQTLRCNTLSTPAGILFLQIFRICGPFPRPVFSPGGCPDGQTRRDAAIELTELAEKIIMESD